MPLDIDPSNINLKEKQICGSCAVTVASKNIFEGAAVIVRQSSKTNKAKGWGGSNFFGRVVVAFDSAKAMVDGQGIVHYRVPVAVESLTINNKVKEVDIHGANLAHDIAPLP